MLWACLLNKLLVVNKNAKISTSLKQSYTEISCEIYIQPEKDFTYINKFEKQDKYNIQNEEGW